MFAITLTVALLDWASALATELKLHRCMKDEHVASAVVSPEQKAAERIFVRFLSCSTKAGTKNPKQCAGLTAQALQEIYHVKDLHVRDGSLMNPTELAAMVIGKRSGWELLGNAADQKALQKAKRQAEIGLPTVAVLMNSQDEGHVALILPGPLNRSAQWNNLLIPNSASLRPEAPDRSYAGCKLSYAFHTPQRVKLYSRPKPH
ncbi:MAG: hypothetical protein ACT4OO_00925 [Nitrospiraceae bacterium]